MDNKQTAAKRSSRPNSVLSALKRHLSDAARHFSDATRHVFDTARHVPNATRHLSDGAGNFFSESAHIEACARGLLRGALAFLFTGARMAMGTYPLGFALLLSSGEDTPFVYIGCLIASLFNRALSLPLFTVHTLIFAVRLAVGYLKGGKRGVFGESLLARMLTAAFCGFLMGAWVLISEGFLFYDLFGAIFYTVFTPIAAFLFSCANESGRGKASAGQGKSIPGLPCDMLFREVGTASILFALVLALKSFSPFSFSLAVIAALFLTFTTAKSVGILRACVIGLTLGAAYDPLIAPAFAVAGLVAGGAMKFSLSAAVIASSACASAYIAYIGGSESLTALLPDLIAAGVLFLPMAKFGILPELKLFCESGTMSGRSVRGAMIAKRECDGLKKDMASLSDSLTELSEVFAALSEKMRRPQTAELRRRCDEITSRYCADCRLQSLCWDEEYGSTADFMAKLAEALTKRGRVLEDELPVYMVERCPDISSICDELNRLHAHMLEEAVTGDKTGLMAENLCALSALLRERVACGSEEYTADETLTGKLIEAFGYLGFYAANTVVFGSRRKFIVSGGVDLAHMRATAAELVSCVESVCGMRFTQPQFAIDGDYITMTMQSRPAYAAEYARAGVTRESESVNGDTVCIFESEDDRLYSLLSDGMGSGREAALTSRMTSTVLRKLLAGGAAKDSSIALLNTLLRNKGIECFATLDLLEIDLLSGDAAFTKSGTVPSYILRDGSLFKISSDSMPLGITRETEAEEIRFTLRAGDIIVMMSDGVVTGEEDAARLCELLTYGWEENLTRMSEKILREAKMRHAHLPSAPNRDDMTLALIRLRAAGIAGKGSAVSKTHACDE